MVLLLIILVLISLVAYAIWYYSLRNRAIKKAIIAKQTPRNHWTADFLESKRQVGDAFADETIRAVLSSDSPEHVNGMFQLIRGNMQKLPDGMHPQLKAYFEETAVLPDWADEDMLRFGQQVYLQHGLFIGMLLFYKSLPECYTGAKGAEVLLKSARLNEKSGTQDHFSRRLAETGLFIYQAMAPKGFSEDGMGIRAVQKIRLIHAVIRTFVKKEGWDTESLGEPINQEDMAGTLMAFSALVLEGLEILGVEFDDVQVESYIHCWRVIGYIMGVEKDLIPVNATDALALGHAVIDHQKAHSGAGVSLTQALIAFCDRKAPFFVKKDFHRLMMTDLMGEELSLMLGLPMQSTEKVKGFRNTVRYYIRIREYAEKTLILGLPFALIDKLLLKFSIVYLSRNSIVSFYFPKGLRADFSNRR
jgi:hypothetical protein